MWACVILTEYGQSRACWICVSTWHGFFCSLGGDLWWWVHHKYAQTHTGCKVPVGHLHWRCMRFLICLTDCACVCEVTQDYDAKLNFYILPALLAFTFINIPRGVLPFSTLASRCMSGNHTRHWGGGSDINVSRNVLRETFFCEVR